METYRSLYSNDKYVLKNNKGWLMITRSGTIYTLTVSPYQGGELLGLFTPCPIQEFTDFLDNATCILTAICEASGNPKRGIGLSALLSDAKKNQA